MNTLVANISTLTKRNAQGEIPKRTYHLRYEGANRESIEAVHVNEGILKALAACQPVAANGGIRKIIALCSREVLNDVNPDFGKKAIDYYSEFARSFWPEAEIRIVETSGRSTAEIISGICAGISADDTVYIDCAGGNRIMSNIIQLLTKMLGYLGIAHPLSLYANINSVPNFIADTGDFDTLTFLADAFNEFMTSGKAEQLNEYALDEDAPEALSELLEAMREFSDRIRMLSIDTLDQTVIRLRNAILACQQLSADQSVEMSVIAPFLPLIKRKLLGETEEIDHLSILQWCLDNTLMQQAFTLYESKVPAHIFEHKLIEYADQASRKRVEEEYSINTMAHSGIEAYALYTDILSFTEELCTFREVVRYLQRGGTPADPQIKQIVDDVRSFNCGGKIGEGRNSGTQLVKDIRLMIGSQRPASYDKLVKLLTNGNSKILKKAAGVQKDENASKYQKNFEAIDFIRSRGAVSGYKINITIDQLTDIMYAYIYMKSLRNRTNHASEQMDFTEEEIKILEQQGYLFSDYSIRTVSTNVQRAIRAVTEPIKQKEAEQLKQEEATETPFEPTTLEVGQSVTARCIASKKVRIDGVPYDVQLTFDRGVDASDLIGRELTVVVHQISGSGRICQVRYEKMGSTYLNSLLEMCQE